jgi:hypothetical protein
LSAASQSFASKPMFAVLDSRADLLIFFAIRIRLVGPAGAQPTRGRQPGAVASAR